MTVDYVNRRILNEVCINTLTSLSDEELLDKYKETASVKNSIDRLAVILDKHHIITETKEAIINDYMLELIPAGTKGVIRGVKFNELVKNVIDNMHLNNEHFEVCFEKQCPDVETTEKPDWYILDKRDGKTLIGMNQLDLWGGGQQLNRGSKYLLDNKINSESSKLLCVVCNEIQFKNDKTKAFKLFQVGFKNNTLCYLKNLPNIINEYFNVPTL